MCLPICLNLTSCWRRRLRRTASTASSAKTTSRIVPALARTAGGQGRQWVCASTQSVSMQQDKGPGQPSASTCARQPKRAGSGGCAECSPTKVMTTGTMMPFPVDGSAGGSASSSPAFMCAGGCTGCAPVLLDAAAAAGSAVAGAGCPSADAAAGAGGAAGVVGAWAADAAAGGAALPEPAPAAAAIGAAAVSAAGGGAGWRQSATLSLKRRMWLSAVFADVLLAAAVCDGWVHVSASKNATIRAWKERAGHRHPTAPS